MKKTTEIVVVVTTDQWHPKSETIGDPELSGIIELRLATASYRFQWEKLNVNNKETIFLKYPDMVQDPHRKPAEQNRVGCWLAAYFVNALAVENDQCRRSIGIAYQDIRGNLGAFAMSKKEVSTSVAVNLDGAEIANLTQFCETHGTKL